MKNSKIMMTIMGAALIAATTTLTGCDKFSSKPQVGVINFVTVQQKAKVYAFAAEQQKKYDEQIQQIIMKDKDFIKLQEEGKLLTEQQKTLSKAEFERRSAALQEKALKINERYRDSFERNAMAAQIALKSVEKEIAEAIEATSQKTGVKILLPVSAILYASEKVDYSDVLVEELDKRIREVNYPNPATLQ